MRGWFVEYTTAGIIPVLEAGPFETIDEADAAWKLLAGLPDARQVATVWKEDHDG